MAWYEKSIDAVLTELNTSPAAGLTKQEAARRLEKYGRNQPEIEKERQAPSGGLGGVLLSAVILLAAALLCLMSKSYLPAAVFFGAGVITTLLRLSALHRVRRVLNAIAAVTAPMTTVVRGGTPEIVDTKTLVPGDLVQLRAGDIIGADMRLIESIGLIMDESILPGGFMGAPKEAAAIMEGDVALCDQINLCHTGTVVRSGSGRAIVVATGEQIAAPFAVRSPYEHERRSTLNRLIARQNKRAAAIGIAAAVLILITSLLVQSMSIEHLTDSILMAAALAVSAIPSSLSIVEAALSAASIRRLALQGVVVRSLDAMDRLTGIDTVLAQKTGVIASGDMTATTVWTGGQLIDVRGRGYAPDGRFLDADGRDIDVSRNRPLALTLIGGVLCGDSDIEMLDGRWVGRGDPTEAALVTLAAKGGLSRPDVLAMFPRIAEFPFEPERRRMTTIHKRGRQAIAYMKGAPDEVIARISAVNLGGTAYTINEHTRDQIAEVARRMTEQGLRVLAVAYREFPEIPSPLEAGIIEQDFLFAGLVGLENRPTPDSVSAFNLCAAAGIRTVIVTGDDPATAADLALSLGVSGEIFEGGEIDAMELDELCEKMRTTRIAARVAPTEKRALVTALKHLGGRVAVTGTRASDAPALMAADIGVSVGAGAPELTRDSADVILEDVGYADIIHAIEEGRRKFTALRSYCGYAFTAMALLFLTVFALLVSTPAVTFSPLQLLWLGVFTTLIPAFALRSEPAERDIMRRPPQHPATPAFGRLTVLSSLLQALLPVILLVSAFFLSRSRALAAGLAETDADTLAHTVLFAGMTLTLFLLAHSARSERTGLFRLGVFTNRPLWLLTILSTILLVLAVHIPALRPIFDTAALSLTDWLIALAPALLSLLWSEVYKGVLRPMLAKNIPERPIEETSRSSGSITQRLFEKFEGDDPTQEEEEPRRKKRSRKKSAEDENAASQPDSASEDPDTDGIPVDPLADTAPLALPAVIDPDVLVNDPEIVEPDDADQTELEIIEPNDADQSEPEIVEPNDADQSEPEFLPAPEEESAPASAEADEAEIPDTAEDEPADTPEEVPAEASEEPAETPAIEESPAEALPAEDESETSADDIPEEELPIEEIPAAWLEDAPPAETPEETEVTAADLPAEDTAEDVPAEERSTDEPETESGDADDVLDGQLWFDMDGSITVPEPVEVDEFLQDILQEFQSAPEEALSIEEAPTPESAE